MLILIKLLNYKLWPFTQAILRNISHLPFKVFNNICIVFNSVLCLIQYSLTENCTKVQANFLIIIQAQFFHSSLCFCCFTYYKIMKFLQKSKWPIQDLHIILRLVFFLRSYFFYRSFSSIIFLAIMCVRLFFPFSNYTILPLFYVLSHYLSYYFPIGDSIFRRIGICHMCAVHLLMVPHKVVTIKDKI